MPNAMSPTLLRRCVRVGMLVGLWFALTLLPAHAAPLEVDGSKALALWPAVTVLLDPSHALTPEEVLARPQQFGVPAGVPSNLGRVADTVWLRVTLHVGGVHTLHRVLEIDYPPLNQVDLYEVQNGQAQAHQRMGNSLRRADRSLPTRTHAAALALAPGTHELLLRVRTQSSVVLPITLHTAASFTAHESQEQLVQGVIVGLALCMLLYSLSHWVSLRDRTFIEYAVLLAGNTVFTLSYFGIGAQYLWPDWPQLSVKVAPMAVLVTVVAGTQFIRSTLGIADISPWATGVLRATGAAAALVFVATLLNLWDYRTVQTAVTVLGLLVTAVVLPLAYIRARRGERVALYMLIGWAFYTAGALTTAALLRGFIEPSFWTQHFYPFSTMVEMAAWMAVLGLRVQTIHRSADRARVETETLRALAQTDALTGLPNRRGLQGHLALALRQCNPQQLLAVYLLDLDGFKPVNDRYGHDVGDALLVAVGRRLQSQLRGSDVVARLGGDEFVVLANNLTDEAAAQAVGDKLLAAFNAPFDAAGQPCEVGLTVGYALAPLDGSTAEDLIKRADAAMYAGKQAGRRRVQRGGRSSLVAS